jgi:hypothetical protein
MFKDVPYFCYSHLLALITVAPAVTTLAPVFNELLLPNSPIYLDKVLTPADIVQAHRQIAQVGTAASGRQPLCQDVVPRYAHCGYRSTTPL